MHSALLCRGLCKIGLVVMLCCRQLTLVIVMKVSFSGSFSGVIYCLFVHLKTVLMLECLVSLAQDEVVVNLPDERLVLVNPQLRKERFSDLGKRLPA